MGVLHAGIMSIVFAIVTNYCYQKTLVRISSAIADLQEERTTP